MKMYKYAARHTQTQEVTKSFADPHFALDVAENMGWEDTEVELLETDELGHMLLVVTAEFPCTYSFHYGEEHYTCELTANRPDSLCPFHAGEVE